MLAIFIIIKTPHGVKSKQHHLISEMTEVKFGHIFNTLLSLQNWQGEKLEFEPSLLTLDLRHECLASPVLFQQWLELLLSAASYLSGHAFYLPCMGAGRLQVQFSWLGEASPNQSKYTRALDRLPPSNWWQIKDVFTTMYRLLRMMYYYNYSQLPTGYIMSPEHKDWEVKGVLYTTCKRCPYFWYSQSWRLLCSGRGEKQAEGKK